MQKNFVDVGVLPWLPLAAPIRAGPITIYLAEALEILGDQGAILADRVSIYRDTWNGKPVNVAVAIHDEQLENGGAINEVDLRHAIDALFIAAVFNNDGQSLAVNGTTLTLMIQRLGGGVGSMALHVRGRNHGMFVSTHTDLVIPRPACAGDFVTYDQSILDAIVAAQKNPNAYRLTESLRWFRRASTDSNDVDSEVDRVLILTAVDFLLVTDQPPPRGLDFGRISALLSPFRLLECDRISRGGVIESCSHIRTALWLLNETRNATVHPGSWSRETRYPFEDQTENRLDWIYDRCFMALLVGKLVELGTLQLSIKARSFVTGVERWLSEPNSQLYMIIVRVEQHLRMGEASLTVPSDFGPFEVPDRARWLCLLDWGLKDLNPTWEVTVALDEDGVGGIVVARQKEGSTPKGAPFPIEFDSGAGAAGIGDQRIH